MDKRPWFQIHLSTAIVLMLVAGVLLGANCGSTKQYIADYEIDGAGYKPVIRSYRAIGWPFPCDHGTQVIFLDGGLSAIVESTSNPNIQLIVELPDLDYAVLWADVSISLSILVLVAAVLEWRIRRRAAKLAAALNLEPT